VVRVGRRASLRLCSGQAAPFDFAQGKRSCHTRAHCHAPLRERQGRWGIGECPAPSTALRAGRAGLQNDGGWAEAPFDFAQGKRSCHTRAHCHAPLRERQGRWGIGECPAPSTALRAGPPPREVGEVRGAGPPPRQRSPEATKADKPGRGAGSERGEGGRGNGRHPPSRGWWCAEGDSAPSRKRGGRRRVGCPSVPV